MSRRTQKPYIMVGAGGLAASLWKRGNADDGWAYEFTLFRLDPLTGEADQLLQPSHVRDLVKLARGLAQAIVDDGCIASSDRQRLLGLAAQIDLFCRVED